MSHVLEQNIVIRDESEYGGSLSNVDNTMIGLSRTAVGQHNNPRDSNQKKFLQTRLFPFQEMMVINIRYF